MKTGEKEEEVKYEISTWIFIRLMGILYLISFTSSFIQFPALFGANGISPVSDFIKQLNTTITMENSYFTHPTIYWYSQSNEFIFATFIIGILSSFLLILNFLPLFSSIICFFLYLSITIGGQNFYERNNSDNLLLESGFLVIFFSLNCGPFNRNFFNLFHRKQISKFYSLILFLFYLLIFRICFFNAIKNLFFIDQPVWRSLNYFNYFFQNQFSPSLLSWYFFLNFLSFNLFILF